MSKIRRKIAYVLLKIAKKLLPEDRESKQVVLNLRKAIDRLRSL